MDGADAGAGQHRDHGFRHHRHIDDDPVALADTEILQHAAEACDLVGQLGVGVRAGALGDGAVVDQRRLGAPSLLDVPVETIVGGIALGAWEPAAIGAGVGIERFVPRLVPADAARGLRPEGIGIALPALVDLGIPAHRTASLVSHQYRSRRRASGARAPVDAGAVQHVRRPRRKREPGATFVGGARCAGGNPVAVVAGGCPQDFRQMPMRTADIQDRAGKLISSEAASRPRSQPWMTSPPSS